MKQQPAAILFDLDGTLVDSAHGLTDTVNDMLTARGLPALAHSALRPAVGSGARGMVGTAFGLQPAQAGYEALRDEFLEAYPQRMMQKASLFDGIAELLDALDAAGLAWGIVTNKALCFADPMTRALGLHPRSPVLVGGDSTPHTKPHPAPLLEAARCLGLPASACVYVGDDVRDMQAGRAAGMGAIAAGWGYLGHGAQIGQWGADTVLARPMDLLQWLKLA